jgi:hypothetical protein
VKCTNCENTEFTCVCGALISSETVWPMPSREQIENAVHQAWLSPEASSSLIVDAVMALLNGVES